MKKKSHLGIPLSPEEKQVLVCKIQDFFKHERDEEIGIIAAEVILEFFIEEIGKTVYNKGLDQSKLWFSKMMTEMEYEYEALYQR